MLPSWYCSEQTFDNHISIVQSKRSHYGRSSPRRFHVFKLRRIPHSPTSRATLTAPPPSATLNPHTGSQSVSQTGKPSSSTATSTTTTLKHRTGGRAKSNSVSALGLTRSSQSQPVAHASLWSPPDSCGNSLACPCPFRQTPAGL